MTYTSVFKDKLFSGKVILVTGGGSGIGRCTAHELAALGAQVVLLGRNLEKLQSRGRRNQTGWRLGELPGLRHSAGRHRQSGRLATIVKQHGQIDGLVNNAGGQYITPLEKISAKGWEAVINTNLTGGFLVARECYVQSMQARGGAIVNIVADIWGSMPGMAHSGAARAGMVSLTETAALEWAQAGVRVNAVAPGYIASSGMDHYPPEAAPCCARCARRCRWGALATRRKRRRRLCFCSARRRASSAARRLRVDGARPQVRVGWGAIAAPAEVRNRDAIKPFDGFHLATVPKVFQS